MKRMVCAVFLALLSFVAMASTTWFDVNFETGYSNNPLVGQSGGVLGGSWLSGGASDYLTTVESSIAQGTKAVETYRSGFGGAYAMLAGGGPDYSTPATTLFALDIMVPLSTSRAHFDYWNSNSGRIALAFGIDPGGVVYYNNSDTWVTTNMTVELDAWYHVEFQVTNPNPGSYANQTLDLFINKIGTGVWQQIADNVSYAPWNGVNNSFAITPQGSGDVAKMYLDNIQILTDVIFVPEPITLLLFSIGSLVLLRKHR